MKTSILFVCGYLFALLVFLGGQLYAESLSNETLGKVKTSSSRWDRNSELKVREFSSSKKPTKILIKYNSERPAITNSLLVDMASSGQQQVGKNLKIELKERDELTDRNYIKTINIKNFDKFLAKNSPEWKLDGVIDIAEISNKGKLLRLRSYPIKSLEIVHTANSAI